MGDAKRRRDEIATLKKKPLERKRVWRRLSKAKTEEVYHFRSEAARRAANLNKHYRNSDEVTHDVKLGEIEQQFVQAIPLKIMTPTVTEKSAPPRKPHPFPIAVGAKGEELAHYVIAMAQVAGGRGFRQPSIKEKNWKSTSLVERLSIAFLGATANTFKRSKRGERKLELRNESNAIFLLDQLIARWPDRALQARHSDKILGWFIGKVLHAYPKVSADWLQQEAKERIKHPRHLKYWHAAERRRAEQEEAEAA